MKFDKEQEKDQQKTHFWKSKKDLKHCLTSFGWDTRARTRNNRTRICCVANYTISQFYCSNSLEDTLISELRCKGSAFRETDKGFRVFFSSKGDFSEFGTRKREEISTFVVRKD